MHSQPLNAVSACASGAARRRRITSSTAPAKSRPSLPGSQAKHNRGQLMTAAELVSALGDRLKNTQLIIVANREPYIHVRQTREARGLWARLRRKRSTEEITWVRPASGLVTALDPVMRAWGGTWVAHGSGSGDREASDSKGRIKVPPDEPAYMLRRVWLSPEDEEGYYYGCANGALWPLCHIAYARPEFNDSDWAAY